MLVETVKQLRASFATVDAHAKKPAPELVNMTTEMPNRPLKPVVANAMFHEFNTELASVLLCCSIGYNIPIERLPILTKTVMLGFCDQILADAEGSDDRVTYAVFSRARVTALRFAMQELLRNASPR